MVRKITVVTVLTIIACLPLFSFAAIDTRAIDAVRSKNVLNSADLNVIDQFVEQAVKSISQTRDFSAVAQERDFLLGYTSKQGQYAQQFSESAHKHIGSALQQAATFPPDRSFKAIINVLILINSLNDASLVDLALGYMADKREPIAYWAVRCATSSAVLDAINKDTGSRLAREVVSKLKQIIPQCSPDGMVLIARFAVGLKGLDGEDLLNSLADRRMSLYEKGTVTDEIIDADILKGLCEKISLNTSGKSKLAARFAQLYSYVIQRYANLGAKMSQRKQDNLRSVIVEVDEKCLTKWITDNPSRFKRALEADDVPALMAEHDRVLGGPGGAGTLVSKLQFSYEGGSKSPKRLP